MRVRARVRVRAHLSRASAGDGSEEDASIASSTASSGMEDMAAWC